MVHYILFNLILLGCFKVFSIMYPLKAYSCGSMVLSYTSVALFFICNHIQNIMHSENKIEIIITNCSLEIVIIGYCILWRIDEYSLHNEKWGSYKTLDKPL